MNNNSVSINLQRESNARFVRWSDGSLGLFVGGELYDVTAQDTSKESNYLFVRQNKYMKCQGQFVQKLTFQPFSLGSKSHKKLTNSVLQRHKKERKIKIVTTDVDPESDKLRKEKV